MLENAQAFIEELALLAEMVRAPGLCVSERRLGTLTSLPRERIEAILQKLVTADLITPLGTGADRAYLLDEGTPQLTCGELAADLGYFSPDAMDFWPCAAAELEHSGRAADVLGELIVRSHRAFASGLDDVTLGDLARRSPVAHSSG